MATDHADYYEVMRELFTQDREITALFEEIDFQSPDSALTGETVGSNFERKYRREGRAIYTLALRKRD